MPKKIRIPANIDESLSSEMDQCIGMLVQMHGVSITRTAYIVKAIKQLNSQTKDDYNRRAMEKARQQ